MRRALADHHSYCRKGLPMVTKQELELTSRIGTLCAGQDPGKVLSALLQNTVDTLALLDAKTREEVEVQYIRTLVHMSASPGNRLAQQRSSTLRADGRLLALLRKTTASAATQSICRNILMSSGPIKEVALETGQAPRLDLAIERIRADRGPGDVLLALLRVTVKHLRGLNLRTREQVVLEFIRQLVRLSETNDDLRPELLKHLIHRYR